MNRLLDVTMVAVGAAAVIAVSILFRREFFAPDRSRDAAPVAAGLAVIPTPDWIKLLGTATWIGPSVGEAQVIEFADFQCPFCAALHPKLEQIRARFGGRLSWGFEYFPLQQIHPYAYAAALSAVCADHQGRFSRMAEVMYHFQESFGLMSFDSLARLAGIPDQPSFDRCRRSLVARSKVDTGLAWANRLTLNGTPAVYVNGRLIPVASGAHGIEQAVENVLAAH